MANPSHDKGNAELLGCPFCGGAARIESNRDWHKLVADHDDDCILDNGDPVTVSPAQDGYKLRIAEEWNRRATPPSPSTAPEADPEKDFSDWMERRGALGAGAVPERIFFAGHSAGRRSALASRPRIKLDPELKAALEEAAKTGATSAALPDGGAVFINRGHDYGDNAHLECTACGGSGHIDDQRQRALASRPAEVDDEGLPALPVPLQRDDTEHGVDYFTAEQYRQGQRDAVAADRARREKEVGHD